MELLSAAVQLLALCSDTSGCDRSRCGLCRVARCPYQRSAFRSPTSRVSSGRLAIAKRQSASLVRGAGIQESGAVTELRDVVDVGRDADVFAGVPRSFGCRMAGGSAKPHRWEHAQRNHQESGNRTHVRELRQLRKRDDPTFVVLAARAIAPLARFVGLAPLSFTLGFAGELATTASHFDRLRAGSSLRSG